MSGSISQWTQDLANMNPESQLAYLDDEGVIKVAERTHLVRRVDSEESFDNLLKTIEDSFYTLNKEEQKNIITFLSKNVSGRIDVIFKRGMAQVLLGDPAFKEKLTPSLIEDILRSSYESGNLEILNCIIHY